MTKKHILYFILIFFWIICYFGLQFDGLYGQDAYEYLRYTEALQNHFTTGINPGDYFWGVYYPLLGSLLSFIVGNSALALQFISCFSLLVSFLYLNKIIELIYKEKTNQYITFLFFCMSPIILIHSFLVMSDMLTCALLLVSIYYFFSYLSYSKKSSFLFGVVFCLIAILTRYAVAVILFPICVVVLFQLIKRRHFILVAYSIPLIITFSLPHVLVKSQNSLNFLSHSWLTSWDILNLFKSHFITVDGENSNNCINLIYVFFQIVHPAFFVFGIPLIIYYLKKRKFILTKYQKILLIAIVLYAFFLGGIPFQNKRFLIQSFPLLLLLIYPYLQKIILKLKKQYFVFSILFFIQITLAIYVGKQYYDRNLLEKTIVNVMKPYQNKTLYVFDIDVAMQGRGLPFNYKNLFSDKYFKFEKDALVLINEKQLEKQWKGKNPLINWENIQKKCVLVKLNTSDKNWSLYKISALK